MPWQSFVPRMLQIPMELPEMKWAKPTTVGTDGLDKEISITTLQKCCSDRKMRILCLKFLREVKMFCIQGLLGDKTIHRIKNMTYFSA